jgi:cytidine deaminase
MMLTTLADETLDSLVSQATGAAQMSYSPYSGFKVGAALLLSNGHIFTGTNVENASLGLTICAERSALARAVSECGPGIQILAVAVANLNRAASPPCGACRQMLAEFARPETRVIFPSSEGLTTMHLDQLLPLGFFMSLNKIADKE